MSKLERINNVLQQELAGALNKQALLEGALVTVSYVKCSPDLKQAKVGVSVLPDRLAGTVLKKLKASTHLLVGNIKGRLKLRRLPKFIWEFDNSEREASKIEELIKEANL
ncbi:MAG: ribosome-binding factor A [Patescibacteria group bacterium]|nr:ribosome-binding factor A [Patescibacteria group bacterium]